MDFSIASLIADHREIETALDRLAELLASCDIEGDRFHRAHCLCRRHYEREERLLNRTGPQHTTRLARLKSQHDEVLEIAARLEEAITAGQQRDSIYLLRRFLAMAQHNIIEEERDVFPLLSGGGSTA